MSRRTPAVTMYPVTVFANTVRIGDILRIDGTSRSVRDMRFLSGGAKRLILDGGAAYTMRNGESLLVFRQLRPGQCVTADPAA
ncbi:MAG: hypothetical protein JO362_13515 [Streptomycetaceae bacterium]|nr:hypothetical protein [Streptomycetaceae bacterium]